MGARAGGSDPRVAKAVDKAGFATAQWRARYARFAHRHSTVAGRPENPPRPPEPQNPLPLDRAAPRHHHCRDPRKQTLGGRHQIGIPAGFGSEQVAGFVGIRNVPQTGMRREACQQLRHEDGTLGIATLIGFMRLIKMLLDGGAKLFILLTGHPKPRNDLRNPNVEESGNRTVVFSLEGVTDC